MSALQVKSITDIAIPSDASGASTQFKCVVLPAVDNRTSKSSEQYVTDSKATAFRSHIR